MSSLTGGGISGQLVSVLGGSYLALSALRDLPGNVTDKAALKIIEESLVEINRLLSEAKNLSLQEIQRHELSGKMLTVSQGRMEKIERDRKSTRLNSSHVKISYAVFCLKKKSSRA